MKFGVVTKMTTILIIIQVAVILKNLYILIFS